MHAVSLGGIWEAPMLLLPGRSKAWPLHKVVLSWLFHTYTRKGSFSILSYSRLLHNLY